MALVELISSQHFVSARLSAVLLTSFPNFSVKAKTVIVSRKSQKTMNNSHEQHGATATTDEQREAEQLFDSELNVNENVLNRFSLPRFTSLPVMYLLKAIRVHAIKAV